MTIGTPNFPGTPPICRITLPLPAPTTRASVYLMRRNPMLPAFAIPPAVWVLALLCAIPEVVLLGADWGIWGSATWRPLAYTQGAFWAGLLHGWTPNYALQPLAMFFTYAWLHASPGHLAGNLAALLWLGPQVVRRRGTGGLMILWCAAMLGGGVAFGLLTHSPAPMVGASGALFGLAADWVVAEVRRLQQVRAQVLRGLGLITLLVALNAAVWGLQGGHLAWETHLGGFLAGLAVVAIGRRHIRPLT